MGSRRNVKSIIRAHVSPAFRVRGSEESKRAAPVFVTGWRSREVSRPPVAETIDMASAIQKITLSASRDIPFNKLVLSQANVRRVKAGVSIEELAEDIARRTLLQGLNVRAVLDAEGIETGMFEVPAGGRRYRALERLVKQKRLAKTAPVPCIVREGGIRGGRIRSPRTCSARRCIRSTSSARSRRYVKRASPRRTSPPPSSSA